MKNAEQELTKEIDYLYGEDDFKKENLINILTMLEISKQNKRKYDDLKNQLGEKLLASHIKDFIFYYFNDKEINQENKKEFAKILMNLIL